VASHYNQRGVCCIVVLVRTVIELSFGVVSGVGPGIHVIDGSPHDQGEGSVSGMVCGIFRHLGMHWFQ